MVTPAIVGVDGAGGHGDSRSCSCGRGVRRRLPAALACAVTVWSGAGRWCRVVLLLVVVSPLVALTGRSGGAAGLGLLSWCSPAIVGGVM
jgi:hypothetical protein